MSFPPSESIHELNTLSLLFSGAGQVYDDLYDLNPLGPTYPIKKRRVAYIDTTGLNVRGTDHPDRGPGSRKCVWKGKLLRRSQLKRYGVENILSSDDFAERPDIVLKFARGPEARERLLKEFDIYENKLRKLQTRVVPRCYGIFGTVKPRAGPIGHMLTCLVLQQLPRVEVPDNESHKFEYVYPFLLS